MTLTLAFKITAQPELCEDVCVSSTSVLACVFMSSAFYVGYLGQPPFNDHV